MGKKVRVTTKCGETFFYDHNQEVDTVEIVEEPQFRGIDVYKKIQKLMAEICHSGGCDRNGRCPLDIDDKTCAYIAYKHSVAWGAS